MAGKIIASCLSPGMDAKLRAAQERIIQLEHKIKEDTKMNELKQQEDAINAEKLEKVIMIMAREITNLQEGKMPELSMVKDKSLKEAQEQLKIVEKAGKGGQECGGSDRVQKYPNESGGISRQQCQGEETKEA